MAAQHADDQPQGLHNHNNRIERVAIVGAGGHIGKAITTQLLKTGIHTVTVLTRPDSTTVLPESVQVFKVDYTNEDSVVAALQGQDFLIITLASRTPPEVHATLVTAAKKAGIKYVMPNVWGPDIDNEDMSNDMGWGPLMRDLIKQVKDAGLYSIVLGCGFWYEWSLGCGGSTYGISFPHRTVTWFDDGKAKISTSSWEQCGKAVAAALSLKVVPDNASAGDESPTLSQYFDKVLYIDSFLISQRDMFESVKRVTNTTDKDWVMTSEDTQERYAKALKLMKEGGRFAYVRVMYTRVFWPNRGGDHSHKGLQNDALGLPKEDLDEQTREALRLVENNELPIYGD